ncbi:MAG: tetratricopeptide repeat protein [Fimbriimonadaceae bacterium]
MYACKQCGTGNPLDSSFCKKCGAALPADELAEARTKLGEMLDEGNNLFTEGRTEEAMLIAEAAVAANPSSHLAYSLKGLCHERLGHVSEALECYETAVGLNADSSLDKVKVAALRNRLAQRVAEAPEPNRRNAAMIGVAAAVLFLVGGSLAAIGMSGKKDSGKVAANTPAVPVAAPLQPGLQQPVSGATPPLQQQAPQNPQATPPASPPAGGAPVGTPSATDLGANLPTAPRTLPAPSGDLGSMASVSPPLEIVPSGPIPPTPPVAAPHTDKTPSIDPPPAPLTTSGQDSSGNATRPEENPGTIIIKMAPRTQPSPGGGSLVPDSNGVTTMLRAAQEDFQLGKFNGAAGKYTQVANMGGNSPRLQQRLGDCFRNLGNAQKARTAYNRAITMYQAQIKRGVDVAGNQRGLDTCESALKVLGG